MLIDPNFETKPGYSIPNSQAIQITQFGDKIELGNLVLDRLTWLGYEIWTRVALFGT